jgi:hypothetical protein
VTDDEIRAARMRSQLLDERADDAAEAVRHMVGIQAQEPRAGALSIRARTTRVTAEDVRRALEEDRTIVRGWFMRGTIHFVAADDYRWLHALFAPRQIDAQHRALDRVGVPADHRPRAVRIIRDALADGPLTRADLCERLESAGIDTAGQRAAYLPRLATLEGHVCFGPTRDGKDTFVLAGDWVPNGRSPADPLRELANRYAGAYAPATARDMAAWSGLPLRTTEPIFEAPSRRVEPPDPPRIRLLPAFDTYLLGYASRDLAVPPEHAREVWPGGGIVRPTIVENGLAVGTWRRTGARVTIEPFGQAPDVAEEVADIERFLSR